MLKVSATAKDNNGIDRVGFWLDRRWVGTDRAAPYKLRVKVPEGHALPLAHADRARLLADGQVSSLGGDAQARAPRRPLGPRGPERGLAACRPSRRSGGTALRGSGTPRHRVVVYSGPMHRRHRPRRQAPEAARRREGQAAHELGHEQPLRRAAAARLGLGRREPAAERSSAPPRASPLGRCSAAARRCRRRRPSTPRRRRRRARGRRRATRPGRRPSASRLSGVSRIVARSSTSGARAREAEPVRFL